MLGTWLQSSQQKVVFRFQVSLRTPIQVSFGLEDRPHFLKGSFFAAHEIKMMNKSTQKNDSQAKGGLSIN
jgi:hypothetical protein